ncbi:RCC1 domain-containing protein [Bifidobacterium polysaccharolyticum]|uniref:RCC1 domain-containing protein n=1 Tax=Bifidobacterium polysaccharolyticum TaxID=2750967 RepID=UPI0021BB1819|nr:InlB B-repeat-containing protein [Bifidobacterium polysaccharolyticum]MCT8158372.1 InlB B-repeat-containing protein [Bifidobacterium polysaccharolyticum]
MTPTPSPLATSSSPKVTTSKSGRSNDDLSQTRSTKHTVTFKDDSTTLSKQSIADGTRASRPPKDPTRDGYLFDGWFTKDAKGDSNVAYDFNQPVTTDFTLTAHWTKGTSSWSISPTSGPAAGGDKTILTTPTKPDIRFSHISSGSNFILALGSDGNLYSWGSNCDGELGRDTSSTPNSIPGLVTAPDGVRFTQTSGGLGLSLALGSDGNIYSWGYNSEGQLGRDTSSKDSTPADRPGLVAPPAGVRFTQVSAGFTHSFAFGSDGNLYSWGDNSDGQLGRDTGSAKYDTTPGKVPLPAGVASFTQVSGGTFYSLAMGSDGNLYSWGTNTFGELGRDTGSARSDSTPRKVSIRTGVAKFTAISAKGWCSLAMDSDGNLYSWGYNLYGELGRKTDNPTINVVPVKVTMPAGITRFIWFAEGTEHTLAMGSDGNLYSWGWDYYGQLGRENNNTSDSTPRKVMMPAGVSYIQASAGEAFSVAMGSDGNLYSWGDNESGQLGRDTGDSTQNTSSAKVAFPENPRPVSVSFGGTPGTNLTANACGTWSVTTPQHAAGKTDVTISWSRNGQQPDAHLNYNYLGSYMVAFDSTDGKPIPDEQQITEGQQATRPTTNPSRDGFLFDGWFLKDSKGDSKVAYDFSQPVTGNITLVAHWSPADTGGWSISPDKGNAMGGQQATITPPKLSRGIRFNQISAGGFQPGNWCGFSVGVASDGNAYAWGSNQYGQLGQGTAGSTPQKTPARVPLPDGVASGFTYKQAVAGGYHVLAVGSDGIVYSWGANDHGQLGDNTTTERSKPLPVKGADGQPFKAVQVSAGAYDSAAISPDGRVYTWGSENNNFTAYSTSKLTPTLAKDPDGSGQGLHAVRVSLGWSFVMAMGTDGNVYTWGYNNYGQFGNGTATGVYSTTYAAYPARVPDPKDTSKALKATQVSAGANHAMAIGQDGTAWAWGYNDRGQLGDGSTTSRPTPEQIQDPANPGQAFQAAWVSAGVHHSLAVDRNGAAWAWGWNSDGQLGDNTTSDRPAPTRVSPPAGQGSAGTGLASARISAGRNHSLAVGQDGNTYSWGDNTYGQLGNGSELQSRTPALAAFNPKLLITGVSFDKTAVNPLQQNPDGSVTLATPVHNPGLADVIVDWTLGGVGQAQVHLAYTYEGVLPLTGGNGSMILLLVAGLLVASGAAAAGRHRRETRIQYV